MADKTSKIDREVWISSLRDFLKPLLNWYNDGEVPVGATEVLAWDDVKVSLASAKRLGNTDPTFEKMSDNGAGSVGVYSSAFSNAVVQEVYFDLQLPHGYRPGTDIKFHLHWMPTSAGAGNVVWGLEYVILNRGVAVGATTIVETAVAAPGLIREVKSPITTISGAGLGESSVIVCRLYRQTVGNTYAAKAFAISADFHIQKDKPGTYAEIPLQVAP